MSWCIEEYAEDAIKKYLENKLDDAALAVEVAWTDEEIKFPCAVVHAGKSGNIDGTAFTGVREIEISIGIMTEAKSTTAKSARTLNRDVRNDIITALAQTALHDDINALEPAGVVFSLAYIGDITRSVESDKRVFMSEIQLVTIAAPKELI